MITVKDALAVAVLEPEPEAVPLTEEEQIQLEALDAAIESGIARTFNGRIFDMKVPTDYTSPNVVAAIRKRYETAEAGWTMGVTLSNIPSEVRDKFIDADPTEIQLIFAPTIARVEVPAKTNTVYAAASGPGEGVARVLVRIPMHGPVDQALDTIALYRSKAGMPITIEVVCGETPTSGVLRRLAELDCVVTVGAGRVLDWDVLIAGDVDMVPVADGYAARALLAVQEHFPHLDGCVYFDDGVKHMSLCTLPVIGRRLYDQFGYVYPPSYTVSGAQEQTEVLRSMGRLVFVPEMIIEHRPATEASEKPAQADLEADKAVYELRKARFQPLARIGFDSPPLRFSICIASLPDRRGQLDRLLDEIYRQMKWCPREVEVLVDSRPPPVTVGEKRQALLERARGHFVAYIDDDDWIASDYVSRVAGAIRETPDADCVQLRGAMTVYDKTEVFETTIEGPSGFVDGIRRRTPNHLTPVRRMVALHVGFPAVDFGEDYDYARGLQPLLKKEAKMGGGAMYHYWFDARVTPPANGVA